jgi:4-aminobutyrate aminotransferase-like enzyme
LIANAKRQGNTMLSALREMQRRFPIMGEVRGHGLMIGVELVKDPKTKAYATEEAGRFLERMREHGILIGRGGRWSNTIRIQPAMIFDDNDTAEFLKTFETVIATL